MLFQLAMLNKSTSQERREILPRHHGPPCGDGDNGVRSTPVAVRRLFYSALAIAVFIALFASYYSSSISSGGGPYFAQDTGSASDVNYTDSNNHNPLYGFYTVLRPPATTQRTANINSNGVGVADAAHGQVQSYHRELSPLQTHTMAVALFGGVPALQKLGFGAAAGMTVGVATKRIFKVAIILVGVIFVAIQAMAIRGWLHVDWNTISREISPQLSAYHHGKVVSALSHNVPFASAFSAGCLFAFVWL